MSQALNPFPGLRPFREDEEYLFFGRESQVDAMVDKLAATRFLAVLGSSGSGKSSLVNCGLRPALHRGSMVRAGSSWRMAQFRPGGEPVQALAAALARDGLLYSGYRGDVPLQEIVETRLLASKRGLVDLWARAQPPDDTNLLVVVDQFEELFRYGSLAADSADAEAAGARGTAFVNLLLETRLHADCRIYVVITMRSDFLGECARFYGLPEAINAGQYLVPRMTREERRAAIVGPIGVGGGEIDPVLLTRLLNDVGDNPDQLSILQHALHRTWTCWESGDRQGPLGLAHYEAAGMMAHALDQHAESAYAELKAPRQALCEKLFRALTDKGTDARGIRRPTALGRLGEIAAADAAEVRAVVDAFRAPGLSFLMPPAAEALAPETVVDISHESLMRVWQRLQRWADQEAQSAAIYRRLAQTARLNQDGQAELLHGAELDRALDWQQRDRPNRAWAQQYGADFESVSDFLRLSTEARDAALAAQRGRRRRRRVLAALAVLALFVFSGYMAFSERRVSKALEQAKLDETKARLNAELAAAAEKKASDALVKAEASAEAARRSASEAEAARQKAEVQTGVAQSALEKAEASAKAERDSEARVLALQSTTEALLRQLDARTLLAVAPPPPPPPSPSPAPAPAPAAEPVPVPVPVPVPSAAPASPAPVPAPAPAPRPAGPALGNMSEAELLAIMPRLQRHSSRTTWLHALNAAMAEFAIDNPPRRAAFLAQIAFETSELRWTSEAWGPSDFQRRYDPPGDLAGRLGNTETGDGPRYRGRGLIQITGRANYAKYSQLIGVDLVGQPDLAVEAGVAARIAGAFWKLTGMNELADAGNFEGITRRINGGLAGQAERRRYYEVAKAALRAGLWETLLTPVTEVRLSP